VRMLKSISYMATVLVSMRAGEKLQQVMQSMRIARCRVVVHSSTSWNFFPRKVGMSISAVDSFSKVLLTSVVILLVWVTSHFMTFSSNITCTDSDENFLGNLP